MAFGDIFKELENLTANKQLLDPITNLPVKQEPLIGQSIDTKSREANPIVAPELYSEREAKSYTNEGIPLGTGEYKDLMMNDMRANAQSNLTATKNAILKFGGKTAITVGDTLGSIVIAIPTMIRNGTLSSVFDNDFHRAMDKASNWMDNIMPIYETKAQEEENFWGKLNNAKFWGDGVMGGLSFTVGAVLSEMALSALTAATFGATAELQAVETAALMSRAKKIFSLFGKDATSAELKAFAKDAGKSLLVGAGYEAGVEARQFLDTARKNYVEQYKQQYGVEPNAQQLAEADGEIKKTANLIFGANMALLSVDKYIQFKNIFGKGLSTDLKLFGKGAVKTEGKDLAKDFALRGTLEASYETASKLRKTLYTVPKLLKNPLNEGFEEGTQGIFNSIGQDYIKKKFDALAYDEAFSTISSFNKNMKDAYLSEDAGIGFIIGAMGIPGMGIATGKVKEAKGFGNKLIASFEGGIAEVFEENRAEKEAIKNAIKLSSKVNIDNVLSQLKATSVNYHTTQQRDAALENGDFFEAKNAESDNMFSFVKTRDNLGLLNETKEQYGAMIKGMDDAEFAKTFGYDKVDANEKALSSMELYERKKKVVEAFNKKVDNFQQSKELASKVAPIRNFNDENARLYNEAIHHLMYTTNDLDSREDSLVNNIKDKLSKTKTIDTEKVKNLMNFHNTWYNLTQGQYSKHLQAYLKDLNLLDRYKSFQHTTSEEDVEYKEQQDKIDKVQKRIDNYEKSFQEELEKINKNKDKLGNYGFNIDYNFKDMDSFKNAILEYDNFRKDIEDHVNQNIFDKLDLSQSIEDLQKIQNKRHELIGTYNVLNTKNGRNEFNKKAKDFEREFKINYLKIQASKFLHNQGLELNKETEKEIEKNVDLQINENDNEELKNIKTELQKVDKILKNEKDIDIIDAQIAYLIQLKNNIKDEESIKLINNKIFEYREIIKNLKNEEKITKKENDLEEQNSVFSDINELFSIFNNNSIEQQTKLNNVASELNKNNTEDINKNEELEKRISFTLTNLDNPNTLETAKPSQKNKNVKFLQGIRNNNSIPFDFQMKVDGELIGGFQMPNQIYLNINNEWNQIDFNKLENDEYLKIILPMLFPLNLVSTTEDRLTLGKYIKEMNNFSNMLSNIEDRKDFSIEEFDKLTNGQIKLNNFVSQIIMSIQRDVNIEKNEKGEIIKKEPIETKIEDILEDETNIITKAAIKTIKINNINQDIVIFGKSELNGNGYSNYYYVKLINGKLERNQEGKVIWNDYSTSLEKSQIFKFIEKKANNINTKDSLFSLLVFNPNGYIQPIFTSNSLIDKIQINEKEDNVINFKANKNIISLISSMLEEKGIIYFNKYKNKNSNEIVNKQDNIYLNDIYFSIKNTNNTNVSITPMIDNGEIRFKIKSGDDIYYFKTYIYYNGENYVTNKQNLTEKEKQDQKEIYDLFKKGEITYEEKIERTKPFQEIINLNDKISKLILEVSNNDKEYKDKNGNITYYNLHAAIRGLSKNNNLQITGVYNNILLNKNNQQSLENLVIKQKLKYNFYIRPDKTDVITITSFSKDIKKRNDEENAKRVADEFNNQEKQIEKQEEAKTINELIQPIQTTQDAIPKGLENIFGYDNNQEQSFESLNQDILKQSFDELGIPFNMLAKALFEKNKTAILEVYNQKSQPSAQIQFQSDVISNKDYNDFIDNNKVNDSILNSIAEKVKNKKTLSQRETAIFTGKTSEVNQIIKDKYNQEVKQTSNIDKLKELGLNIKQLNGNIKQIPFLYKLNKLEDKISLDEFTELIKNANKEIEDNNIGVNKLLELSNNDLIEYNQAIKNLAQILPIKTQDNPDGIIEVTDVIDLLKNLKTKGEIGGRFISKSKTIYLKTTNGKSIKGIEYHEAFHAVFRLLLPNNRIVKYLRSAESKYGTPTLEQLEELKNSSSDLYELSNQDLKNLWLEEKLADDFMEYSKNNNRIQESWLKRLFNKIKDFLKSIFSKNSNTQTSNEKIITQLFQDIYNGQFKNSKEKFPIQRNGIKLQDVNKLLKNDYKIELSNGKFIDKKGYLSYSISEAIINTAVNEASKLLKNENKNELNEDDFINLIKNNIQERFNPYNKYNEEMLLSITDSDLAIKTFNSIQNVYDSLENPDNFFIIKSEVLKRLPLLNLELEDEKDINDLENLEFTEDEEGNLGIVNKSTNEINHSWEKASKRVKQYISSISLSSDLFNIGKPFIDFINKSNNEYLDNFSFAINGNHLYSNLIKMLVGTPSYKHLKLLYSLSSTSPEIKAFTQQWYKDIYNDLYKDKSLNLPKIYTESFEELYKVLNTLYYDDLNKSQYFNFISSDLEKNRIYLQDILFDNNGSTKMLNANNRDVSTQLFNIWEKNWESKRENNIDEITSNFENNIYTELTNNILQDYLNLLEKNLSSEKKSKAIINIYSTFKNQFNNLGIELPELYIKYSLLNYVIENKKQQLLTNEELNWYNNFSSSEIKPINIEILNGFKISLNNLIKYNRTSIYSDLDENQKSQSNLGAIGKIKDIAESVSIFNPSIIPSSFNNQEGKRISDIVPPSDISRRLNILKDKENLQLIKDYLETKNAKEFKDKILKNRENNTYYFYSFFTNEYQIDNFLEMLDNNPLFDLSNNLDVLFSMSYAGGIRQIESEIKTDEETNKTDIINLNYGLFANEDGKSYSNADLAAKILYRLSLLSESDFNKFNIKKTNKDTDLEQKTVFYIPSQFEGKSTVPMINLPLNSLIEENTTNITEKGKNALFSIFKQEYNRITKTQNEINEFIKGNKKEGYNEGFHYVLQEIGIENSNKNKTVKIFKNEEGKFFYLDINNGNKSIKLQDNELWYYEKQKDNSYLKKEINKEKLIPRGLKFFNLKNENSNVNQFTKKAIKGEELTENEILEIKENLSKFNDLQFNSFINELKKSHINLINNDNTVNVLPKGFIINDNNLDKTSLLNAFLNDYLMSYSINSLLYGDNAYTTKDSIDWVKRAGGMIGSGSNYGSGVTNIILSRSEVKNGIDTTDAQTFSTPFYNLSTILKHKGANDNRILQIYQGIDSGLDSYINDKGEIKKITVDDYDYLYDNNAQHQPNKTQGFSTDSFLKTSITAILRSTTSTLKNYSKEGKLDALILYKELFNLKLELFYNNNPSQQDIENYKEKAKEYQNLFRPIPGQLYRHNLLNNIELHNSICVYDSAWKRSKVNIHELDNGNPYLYKNNDENIIVPIQISNSSLIDQQKTDGVKSIITHATQLLRLITTEQLKDTIVYFKDKKINIDTVLTAYENNLANRISKGFKELKKQIINEYGEAKWEILLDSFITSIQSSSNDPQQLELFQIGDDGKPKFNLNNPAIETKFQAMFLSFISNGTLKQKVAGSKLALSSSIGYELLRKLDNNGNIIKTYTTKEAKKLNNNIINEEGLISSRLKHDVEIKDNEGTVIDYYSEIVVSERFLRKFGYTLEQFHKGEIPEEFLFISGVRIPTEDKHSMVNCKIVDVLPDSYGNIILVPDEIIKLSGADFDIDSLYVRVNQTYSNILTKKTEIYGNYLYKPTIEEATEQAYNEYLADIFSNKQVQKTFKDLKINNQELKKLNDEKLIEENNIKEINKKINDAPNIYTRDFINQKQKIEKENSIKELIRIKEEIKNIEFELIKHSFKLNNFIFNKENWLSKDKFGYRAINNYKLYQKGKIEEIKPLTKGENNNILLELERKLINNTGNNKISNTETSLDLFKNLIKTLEKEGLINKELGYGIHDMLSKILADNSIAIGSENISPVALFNNLYGLLIKNNINVNTYKGNINEDFVLYSKDENNKKLEIDENNPPQRIQEIIATSLAAMTDNAKEQLASIFNLTITTLPVALTMLSLGHNFNNVMLLMKSPIIKQISELETQYKRTIKSQQDYDNSKSKESIQQKIEKIFQIEEIKPFEENLDYKTLLEHLKYFNDSNLKSEDIEKTPAQVVDKNQIYSQLGNKTQSENVILPKDLEDNTVYEGKNFWDKIVPEAKSMFDRKFPGQKPMIIAFRGNGKKSFLQNYKEQFIVGNPFDWQTETGSREEKGIKSTKKFIDWLITGNNFGEKNATEEYRQAIINDIKSGEISKSPILYYEEKDYATHATALDYLINKYDWSNKTVDKNQLQKQNVEGENITSKGSEFAKKLTNVGNTVGLTYKGKDYVNSEHAYQTWKSGEFNQQGYDLKGGKVRGGKIGDTFSIMTDILTEKLKQHPELVLGINERGGLKYLQKSTHNVIGDKFWETNNGQNKFIESLTQAYKNISQVVDSEIDERKKITTAEISNLIKQGEIIYLDENKKPCKNWTK